MHQVPTYFCNQNRRGTTQMPRPKSELTKSGKAVGIRLTESEFEEYKRLGASKWLRKFLQESRDRRKND
jgi:hypothetical protein